MRFFRICFVCLTVFASTAICKADDFTSYQINATLSDGSTFSPVLNVDTTNVFGTTLVGSYANSISSGTINKPLSVVQGGPYGPPDETSAYIFALANPNQALYLFFPGQVFTGTLCVTTQIGITPGCNIAQYVSEFYDGSGIYPVFVKFDTAQITPLAVTTPEPSTFALVGSGLLGIVGAVRRKSS